MKSTILLSILVLLFSCNDKGAGDYSLKEYTVKVTFQDRTSDTFKIKGIDEPYLYKGELQIFADKAAFQRSKTIASGVRSFKILE